MTRLEQEAIKLFDKNRDEHDGFTTSNIPCQVKHLGEEVGEFIEAVMNDDTDNALMEAGDVAWLMVDILNNMQHGKEKYLLAVGMASSLQKLQERWSS